MQQEKIGVDIPERTVHHLKTRVVFFEAILTGAKTFEIRYNDRDFQVEDGLILQEWDDRNPMEEGHFTGREIQRTITYITDFQQRPGYIVMGISR